MSLSYVAGKSGSFDHIQSDSDHLNKEGIGLSAQPMPDPIHSLPSSDEQTRAKSDSVVIRVFQNCQN